MPPDESVMDAFLDGLSPRVPIAQDHAEKVAGVESLLKKNRGVLAELTQFGYFVPIVFASQVQADAFLAAADWSGCVGHDAHGFYLDGVALAAKLGVVLPGPLASYRPKRMDHGLIAAIGIITPEEG